MSALWVVGCSQESGDELSRPPTGADLKRLERAPYLVYWLGWEYRGMRLSKARFDRRGTTMAYGREICDPGSGCTHPLSISSFEGRPDAFPREGEPPRWFDRMCFRRVRGALFIECPDADVGTLLTGRQQIVGIPPPGLNHLRRVGSSASSGRRAKLPPPVPLTCDEQRKLAAWFLERAPASLKAHGCKTDSPASEESEEDMDPPLRPLPRRALSRTHEEVERLLNNYGATAKEASEIVAILSGRLSPRKMHIWLADPKKSHGVPDPESEERFGAMLNWTPVNAISRARRASCSLKRGDSLARNRPGVDFDFDALPPKQRTAWQNPADCGASEFRRGQQTHSLPGGLRRSRGGVPI